MAVLEHKDFKYECSECHAYNKKNSVNCWKCGVKFTEIVKITGTSKNKIETVIEAVEYPALKTISAIFRVMAWLVGIAAVITLIYGLFIIDNYETKEIGIVVTVYSLIGGLFGVVFILALSEGIKLLINIANDVKTLRENIGK